LDTFASRDEGSETGIDRRSVHPVVRLNRIVRIVGCPMAAVVVATVRLDEPTSPWIWGALFAYAFVWPHAAYWIARLSRDQKRAAHLCLMFDCACFGASGALVSYRLVPMVVMMTGILTAVMGVGGVPLFAAGLAVLAAVFVAGSLALDWRTATSTPLVSIVLSLAVAFLFQLLLAFQSFRQARELILKRRQLEEQSAQIVQQNAALEQAMLRAEEARRAVEAANLAKSRFLANMSHELRTPLNAIIGYTELMLDSTYGELPERARATLTRVERSGRHLLALINEVLDLSKIEAGQYKLEVAPFAIGDTIGAALSSLESLAREKGLKVGAQPMGQLPNVLGDERRILQVLMNLVGNAIKFTASGEVEVGATVDGDHVLVTVRDTGPGIAPEFRTRIFHEFQQGDTSTTRPHGGTGLGLAISRRIVELHGGTLSLIHTELGAGSTFGFTLPRAGSAAGGPAAATGAGAQTAAS
jgi:signal transduction histidine kinase